MKIYPLTVYIIGKNWEIKRTIKFPQKPINIYNIDKLSEVREKIYTVTAIEDDINGNPHGGIDPRRQHLRGLKIPFTSWLAKNKKIAGSTDEEPIAYITPSHVIHKKYVQLGAHVPVDNINPSLTYYNKPVYVDTPLNKGSYITVIHDINTDNQYITLHDLIVGKQDIFINEYAPLNEIVLFDLAEFIPIENNNITNHNLANNIANLANNIANLAISIAHDAYIFERIYYGFIIKYFPQLSEDNFREYLRGVTWGHHKGEISAWDLEERYRIESEELLLPATKAPTLIKSIIYSNISVCAPGKEIVNLRNMFDKIHIGPTHNGGVAGNHDGGLPGRHHDGGLPGRGISGGSDLSSTGRYGDLGIQMMHFIMPATEIPTMGPKSSIPRYVITKHRANTKNYKIPSDIRQGLTLVLSSKQYINIKEDGSWLYRCNWNDEDRMTMDEIFRHNQRNSASIISYINNLVVFWGTYPLSTMKKNNSNFQKMTTSSLWNKSLSNIEFKELREQFNKFIDNGMAEPKVSSYVEAKWLKGTLSGCIVRFRQRVFDIRVEIIETTEKDEPNVEEIIRNFLGKLKFTNTKQTKEKESDEDQRIVSKLREQDPRLYDGLKEDYIYSKKCQGVRQPLILTDAEAHKQPKNDVVKFWNFTKNKPAYYTCQYDPIIKKKYYFSYLTDIHRENWCVPCCKRKPILPSSKHYKRDRTCDDKHIFKPEEENITSSYIFVPYKILDPGRLGRLPDIITNLLDTTLSNTTNNDTNTALGLYAVGVSQKVPSNSSVGIVHAIAAGLNISIEELALKLAQKTSNKGLAEAVKAIFISQTEFYDWFRRSGDGAAADAGPGRAAAVDQGQLAPRRPGSADRGGGPAAVRRVYRNGHPAGRGPVRAAGRFPLDDRRRRGAQPAGTGEIRYPRPAPPAAERSRGADRVCRQAGGQGPADHRPGLFPHGPGRGRHP